MSKLRRLVFLMLIRYTYVTSLSLCDTDDGYLEYENKQDNRFTCRDIPQATTVTWIIIGILGQVYNLSTCPPPTSSQQSTCITNSFPPGLFVAFRISTTTSFIIVNATATSSPNSVGSITLGCTTATDQKSCPVDYISRASRTDATCKVQFTNSPWSVLGQCNITKVFSGRGRYRCRIYESNGKQGGRLLRNATMPTTSTGVDEFSGNCTFSSYLPPDGRYNYTAVIIPGEVEFPVVFTGNNEIRTPSTRPSHNCPNILREGQDIKCACSVSDYGAPSGTLQWNNTGSTQLSLTDVTRVDNGRRFECRLTWNNTDVWTVSYTLIVTYPPMIVDLKINSSNVDGTVSENSPVTLSCEAKGHPSPGMTFIAPSNQVLSTVPVGDVTTTDFTRELKYYISEVQCEDSGNYTCDVDNGVGRDRKNITLLVKCPPRASPRDTFFPSVNFKDKEPRLQFNLTSYPTPEVVSIRYLGQSGVSISSGRPVSDITVSAECTPAKGQLFLVICTAAVHNVTSDSVGIYRITVRNGLGQLELVFEIKTSEEESEHEPLTADDYRMGFASGIGVGVGVTVGVFGILHVAGVFWVWRRNWVLPCRQVKKETSGQSVSCAADKEGPDYSHVRSGSAYDALRLNDIGMKSVYSSLRAENDNARESTDYELTTESASNQGQQTRRHRKTQPTARSHSPRP